MRSVHLAGRDVRSMLVDPFVRIAMFVVVLVPLLYGALYLWAFWDPYSRLDRIPVGIVNLDRAANVDGERVTAGNDLVEELRDRRTFDWQVVSAAAAHRGLDSGRYYMVLTIPSDFSASLGTADSSHPIQARLTLTQRESSNMLASQIGGRVFSELRAASSASVSKGYYDHIFIGFGDIRDSLSTAADGARDLHSGLATARTGAGELAAGSARTSRGAAALAGGVESLATGAARLDAGAETLKHGSAKLASGLKNARAGSAALDTGAEQTAAGAAQLANASASVSAGAQSLAKSAAALAEGAHKVDDGVASAAPGLETAASGSSRVAGGADGVVAALEAYAAAHPEASADPAFAKAVGAAAQTKAGAHQVADGLAGAVGSLATLAPATRSLAAGASDLAAGAGRLSSGAKAASSGAERIAIASAKVANGTGSLAAGVAGASTGAVKVASGSSALSAGAGKLAAGASDASAGAGKLAAGAARLEGGARTLASALGPAVKGSRELAAGLTAGVRGVPAFSAKERAAHAEMMSDPVSLTTRRMDPVPNYGTGFSPYFMPLALWIGAVMIFFIVPPLSPRALGEKVPAPIATLASYWPAALLGVVQTVIMLLVLRYGLGLDPRSVPGLFAFAALTSLVFVAILQWLSGTFGLAGKFVAIVLLMLQLTSSAGTYPLETLPGFFRAISPFLPMTYVVAGFRQIISGGDYTAAVHDALVLSAFGVGALALSFVSARLMREGRLALATREL